MKIENAPKLDFNNVLIRPKRTTLNSRSDVDLTREFKFPHSTKKWKGGKSREEWSINNKPKNPGRLNDLRHIIYKSADTHWRQAKKNIGLMLKEGDRKSTRLNSSHDDLSRMPSSA
jgi:hypothetical protein